MGIETSLAALHDLVCKGLQDVFSFIYLFVIYLFIKLFYFALIRLSQRGVDVHPL